MTPNVDSVGTRRQRMLEALVVLLLLGAALAMRTPSLRQPLLEAHGFRQTQTALTARLFHEEGIDLLHPKLPVLGDPGEVPFEFPLFQALASIPMAHGLSPDVAMRVTCLAFFMLSAVLVWGLTRRLAGALAAFVALAVFLFSPLSLLWSRTSMIEYVPTAGALTWLWAAMVWRDRRPAWAVPASLVGGALALLVKPATAVFWVIPLVLYRPDGEVVRNRREWFRSRWRDPALVAMVVLPFVVTALWVRHTDRIKEPQLATRWLTSGELHDWNFGSIAQRLDPATWDVLGGRLGDLVVGLPLWQVPLLVGLALAVRRRRAMVAALFVSACITVLVFVNLYWVHDYYMVAITPQVAIIAGCAVPALVSLMRSTGPRLALVGLLPLWIVALPLNSEEYWTPMYLDTVDPVDTLSRSAELAAVTRPDDRVLFEGFDLSPAVPYYSHRSGMMLTPRIFTPRLLDSLPAQHYDALITQEFGPATDAVLDRWPWVATPSSYVYYLAERPDDLRGGRLLAGRDPKAMPTGPTLTARRVIPCTGAAVDVPTGPRWTWLRFEAGDGQGVTVREAHAAALPARRVIAVPQGTARAGSALHVHCTGGGEITLVAAVDGPPPTGPSA